MKQIMFLLLIIFVCQFTSAETWKEFLVWFEPHHEEHMKQIANFNSDKQCQEFIDGIEAWLSQHYPYIKSLQNDLKERPEETAAIQERLRIAKYHADAYLEEIAFSKRMMALIKNDMHRKGRSKEEYIESLITKSKANLDKLDTDRQYVNNLMAKKDHYNPDKKESLGEWMKNKAFSFLAGVDYEEINFRFKEFKISAKNQRSILLYASLLNWAGTISDIGKPDYLKVLPDTSQLTGIAAKQAILMAVVKQFAEDPEYALDLVMKAQSYVRSSLQLKK